MNRRRAMLAIAGSTTCALFPELGNAQAAWPSKPIKLVVPYPAEPFLTIWVATLVAFCPRSWAHPLSWKTSRELGPISGRTHRQSSPGRLHLALGE
jgi:hypothetical protein